MTRIAAILIWLLAMAGATALASPYTLTLLNYVGMAALVALGLVLLTGAAGLTSFGQAAFVGIGAYAAAWLSLNTGASAWWGLVLALGLTSLVATLLGAATLRLGGHLLPLTTIAWGLAFYFLFGNLDMLGRHNGLQAIAPVSLAGWSLGSAGAGFVLVWVLLGLALWLCANLLDSRQGRAMRSLRGGTAMAESLGINSFAVRLLAFVLAALLAGLSGWLLAHVQRFISPTAFDVGVGIEYLFMAMLGGAGSIMGAVLGAALVTFARDGLQDLLPHLMSNSGQAEIVVFSLLFILVLQTARGGLIPAFARFLPAPRRALPPTDTAKLPRRTPPARGTEVLRVAGLTRRFGGLVAVNGLDFSVPAGTILGLIGPNGAGKSTAFNLITGVLPPSAGRIHLLGQDITDAHARHIAASGVARSFQHVKLRPTMSLLENVMLGTYRRTRAGALSGALRLDRAEDAQAMAEALRALRRVGLTDDPHGPAGALPLGRQRLLEVARALAADPILLLLDEPAAGLRRPEKLALAQLLRDLRAEGLTILIVEHDMEFVMGLVDHLVVMQFGTKLAEGVPAVIRADPAVQAAYLGGAA